MEWYAILGLCIGIVSILFFNIWYNRLKWKKWIAVWGDGQLNQDDFISMKEAFASFGTAMVEIVTLLGVLKKDADDGE